jgi:hypothetical protein
MSDSGNGTYTAPYAIVSSTDHGGQLLIIAVITIAITLLSVVLRIHISRRESRSTFAFYKDDILFYAAAVCSRQTRLLPTSC